MRFSIRLQVMAPLLAMFVGMVVMSAWTALAAANRAEHQIESQMRNVAKTVTSVTFPRNVQTLRLMKGLSGAEFLLADRQGSPILQDRQPVTTLPAPPDDLPNVEYDSEFQLGPRFKAEDKTYFGHGVFIGPDENPNYIVYLFYPESLWKDALWQAVRPSLIVGLTGGIATLLLTIIVAGRLGRRIRQLERRTRLIAAGDFSPMPLPTRDDELRDLGRSVNEMAQRLADLQETVKTSERLRLLGQVSGGLAHQLRNSVTGARLAVQLHARSFDNGGDSESLTVALRQLSLVEMQLKQFLNLGRTADVRKELCSVSELLRETVSLLRPQFEHAHIELRFSENNGDDTILGDADQLRQVLVNLLTNAMEAASPGGWVEADWRSIHKNGAGQIVIRITDSGSGPSSELAPRLFEPFATGKKEGVGLGLAAAKQIAKAHGGDVSWRRVEDTTRFEVRLPMAERV